MTDAEIIELSKAVASQSAASVTALVFVIRSLQAQPGFDHPAFVRTLAALAVGAEGLWADESQREVFEATIRQFADSPISAPPAVGGR